MRSFVGYDLLSGGDAVGAVLFFYGKLLSKQCAHLWGKTSKLAGDAVGAVLFFYGKLLLQVQTTNCARLFSKTMGLFVVVAGLVVYWALSSG